MARPLPYRVVTQTGDLLDFRFPLHPETVSAMRVDQILSAALGAVDREIKLTGDAGNGDVLQALAMALAVRARMIHADGEQTADLARVLLEHALQAEVTHAGPSAGRA